MKKLFTLSVAVLLSVLTANAQWGGDEPEQLPPLTAGYYRIVNQAYNDVLNVTDSFQIAPSALRGEASTLPSTVMYYDTDGVYTVPMPEDLSDVNVLLNWLNEISLNSYRSGSYITYKFGGNGISFIDYLNKLKMYVDKAMENFIEGDNLKFIFENDQPELIMVMVSDLMTPYAEQANIAVSDIISNLDNLKGWFNWYFQQWKPYFDYNIYLKPTTVANNYQIMFKTPPAVTNGRNMKDIQSWVNGVRIQNGKDTVDFWNYCKERVMDEVVKDYPEGTEGYSFIRKAVDNLGANIPLYLAEDEEGQLTLIGIPVISMDGIVVYDERVITWIVEPVDEKNPVFIAPDGQLKDGEGNYYKPLFTDFPYKTTSSGTEVFYVNGIENGKAQLAKIEGTVPANTAVLIRTENEKAEGNIIVPVDEVIPPLADNLLKGSALPVKSLQQASVLSVSDNSLAFVPGATSLPANSVYMDTPADGSNIVIAAADPTGIEMTEWRSNSASNSQHSTASYNLNGQRVDGNYKGIVIRNGKKTVRK